VKPAEDPGAERRRQAIRRAGLYTWGFLAAAIVTAVGGAALIAWVFSRTGVPFLAAWGILIAVIVVPSLLLLAWRGVKERTGGPKPGGKGTGADDGR
jgi:hypothetical protein